MIADRRGADALTAGGSWRYGPLRRTPMARNGKQRISMLSILAFAALMTLPAGVRFVSRT